MTKAIFSVLSVALILVSASASQACGIDGADRSTHLETRAEEAIVLVSGIEEKQAVEVSVSHQEESITYTY